jgi:hypothetical protein
MPYSLNKGDFKLLSDGREAIEKKRGNSVAVH